MSNKKNQLIHSTSPLAKVLVAEDNVMNQKVIETLLRKADYEVRVVSNGNEALLALEHSQFNCLILDYQMPELDGLQTLQIIRNHGKSYIKEIPVIFLTAELDQHALDQIEQYNLFQRLAKPIEPKKLMEAVGLVISLPKQLNSNQDNLTFNYLYSITDGNAELMVELINIFLEEAPLAIQNMKANYETNDLPALLKTIHKIRSNYKYVGMLEGEKLLADLEKDIELNQNAESYMDRILEIDLLTQKFMQALSKEKQSLQKLINK